MHEPTHLVVGHVTKPHGTGGEVLVMPLTDHPGSAFAPGVVLQAASEEGHDPDPDFPPLRVAAVRPFRGGLLVTFGGVENRDQAERLRDVYLMRPVEELAELEEGELFYHELLGMDVVTVDGREVGRVQEVYELLPADMLEVRGASGTVLVPLTKEVVREVDREARRIVLDPPEGLLEL